MKRFLSLCIFAGLIVGSAFAVHEDIDTSQAGSSSGVASAPPMEQTVHQVEGFNKKDAVKGVITAMVLEGASYASGYLGGHYSSSIFSPSTCGWTLSTGTMFLGYIYGYNKLKELNRMRSIWQEGGVRLDDLIEKKALQEKEKRIKPYKNRYNRTHNQIAMLDGFINEKVKLNEQTIPYWQECLKTAQPTTVEQAVAEGMVHEQIKSGKLKDGFTFTLDPEVFPLTTKRTIATKEQARHFKNYRIIQASERLQDAQQRLAWLNQRLANYDQERLGLIQAKEKQEQDLQRENIVKEQDRTAAVQTIQASIGPSWYSKVKGFTYATGALTAVGAWTLLRKWFKG